MFARGATLARWGVRGRAPAALSRAARLWRHPTGGRLGMVPRVATFGRGLRGGTPCGVQGVGQPLGSRFQGTVSFGQGFIRAERHCVGVGLPRGGSPCRSVRAEAVKAGSRGRIWRPLARSTIADCITALFCRFPLRPADRPKRLHAARFFARGRQRTNRWKLALRAILRGTEPLISVILFGIEPA